MSLFSMRSAQSVKDGQIMHSMTYIYDQAIACPSFLIVPQRVALSSQAHCLCLL